MKGALGCGAESSVEQSVALQSEARKRLLRIMISKFSSTPIDSASPPTAECGELESIPTASTIDEGELRQQLDETENSAMVLTQSERNYLSALLDKGDVHSMRTASQVLQDESVFPTPSDEGSTVDLKEDANKASLTPRSSKLQQQLFRIHTAEPSPYDRQQQYAKKSSIIESSEYRQRQFASKNSILESSESLRTSPTAADSPVPCSISPAPPRRLSSRTPTTLVEPIEEKGTDDSDRVLRETEMADAARDNKDDELNAESGREPFDDIASWLDGGLGIEVCDDGSPLAPATATAPQSRPFRILGTSADDVSCHPHVLSPPLMESLLQFVPPEPANGGPLHVWLKYSLVRDGPGVWNFLRQTRASTLSFLAIETEEGDVFGAFTSQPWRLSMGWYGGNDSFLWKLRRSRLETTNDASMTLREQIQAESEVQVYPYRTGHKAVQYCSKECLMLGNAEIIPSPVMHDPDAPAKKRLVGTHYGHGLHLNKDLLSGSTSTSETFGNPCLIDCNQRGQQFRVANVELWSLTPHDTVEAAERSELSSLFLERTDSERLNVLKILVGGPI